MGVLCDGRHLRGTAMIGVWASGINDISDLNEECYIPKFTEA